MDSILKDISIEAISVCVPKKIFKLKHLSEKGNESKILNSSNMLGVKQNYISNPKITTLDLCHAATRNIIKALKWKPKDIDIVVFVTQTPDYLMPSCSNIIHEKLELKKECICYDINLGCSGYVYGITLYGLANFFSNINSPLFWSVR